METANDKSPMRELVEVIQILRGPGGCAWDRKQTHVSLKDQLVEECAELLDAIDQTDDRGMCEELGDVLLHVVFHARIAEDEGRFSLDDVVRQIVSKLKRRHPHVFGEAKTEDVGTILERWQEIKAEERAEKGQVRDSVLDGVPRNLPALTRALLVQRKAAAAGFDWDRIEGTLDKLQEELDELRQAVRDGDVAAVEDEVGDVLYSVVNFCRFQDERTAEKSLQAATDKFERRFRWLEAKLRGQGLAVSDQTPETLDGLWREAKNWEKGEGAGVK